MENRSISEYALEVVCTRMDKINVRLTVALILTIILLFASNVVWVYTYIQFDYTDETTTETITLDTGEGGNANYANHGGSVVNGEDNCYYEKAQEDENEEEA